MDKASKRLLCVFFLSVIASLAFTYKHYILDRDFDIYQNDDGVPIILEE